ncbi:MAG: hypothetical protein KatS3mg034_1687 [Vicingaceae bacterium]|nr:MAG: hypothetical protein KatS3mg034_1687 [Vicingaceae bacterium]
MKIHWGHGIILSFVFFAAFILYMVVHMYQSKVELVDEDYYKLEIEYQKIIDLKQNFNQLGPDALEITQKSDSILIRFKQTPVISGEIHLYVPNDKSADYFTTMQNIPEGGVAGLSKKLLHNRLVRMKIRWDDGKKQYYTEKNIFVN